MQERDIELIKDESLSQKLIKKWFWLYFFGYLSAPLRYVIRVIISNSPDVSVAEFWVLYGVISLITLLYTYNDLWLTESLQYFLPRFYFRKQFDNIKTTIYVSLFSQILTGIIIALWLWFGSDWLALHYFQSEIAGKVLKYFCFYFICTNILQVIQTIFIAFQKTFEYQFVEFIKVLSIALFTIGFFFIDKWNIEFYSIARLWWIFIAIIIAFFLYKKYRGLIIKWKLKRDWKVLKEYTKYAMWAFAGISIRNLFDQIILQMVVYILWVESAWYYSNFLGLFAIWVTILWPIRFLLFPLASEYKEKGNIQWIERLISIFYNYFTVITLSFSVLFVVFWPEISVAFFGEKYLLSWILLSYGWIFLLFRLLASFNFQILAWLWKVKERVLVLWITCLLTITISIIGIKIGWIYWGAISFGISNVIYRILSFCLLKKEKFKFKLNRKFVIKNIALLFVLWFMIYSIKNYIFQYGCSRWMIMLELAVLWVVFCCIIGVFNMREIMKIRLKDY
jgi:O-antigen/teichoic acid export membrane protein